MIFYFFQDSAYMALTASTLRDVVKPEKISEFQHGLTGLCNDVYNPVGDRWSLVNVVRSTPNLIKKVPGK